MYKRQLKCSFYDQIAVCAQIFLQARSDGCNDRVSLFLGDLALSNQLLVALLDLCQAVLSPLLLDVAQSNGCLLDTSRCV